MKTCSKCKTSKDLIEFYKNKARYDVYCNFCKECDRKKPINKARKQAYNDRYKAERSEFFKAYYQQYYLDRKEQYAERNEKWIEQNRDRWQILGRQNAAKPKTRARHRFQEAKRRAKKLNATPPWVDMAEIKKIYDNCPPGYHVDHIIPLNHPLISGLHVPWNLQYLPALENIRKNNKVEGLDGIV